MWQADNCSDASASRCVVNTWTLPFGVVGENSCTYRHLHLRSHVDDLCHEWLATEAVFNDCFTRLCEQSSVEVLPNHVNSHLVLHIKIAKLFGHKFPSSKVTTHLHGPLDCSLLSSSPWIIRNELSSTSGPPQGPPCFPRGNFAMGLTVQNSPFDWVRVFLCVPCLHCCYVLWSDTVLCCLVEWYCPVPSCGVIPFCAVLWSDTVLCCLVFAVCFSLEVPVLFRMFSALMLVTMTGVSSWRKVQSGGRFGKDFEFLPKYRDKAAWHWLQKNSLKFFVLKMFTK